MANAAGGDGVGVEGGLCCVISSAPSPSSFSSSFPRDDGNKVTMGKGGTGVEYTLKNCRTASYSILLLLLCRVEAGGGCGVGVMTNEERRRK